MDKTKMKLFVLNGPNINLLGTREPSIYGNRSYADLCKLIEDYARSCGIAVDIFQTNHEGVYIDRIQGGLGNYDGFILNPAGYTHTSVAIADAVAAVGIPSVEVHISDPDMREDFRKISYIRPYCIATVKGLGLEGYLRAIDVLKEHFESVKEDKQ